jgi:3-oxoacyl-[acyl-carrier-protein] synthase-3
MDLNAACAGFVYGLVTAYGLMGAGVGTVLLVGSETLSRITDWDDRATCILFGDGAGAVVLQSTDDEGSLRGWDLGADGTAHHLLYADVGGYLKMDGREVFRRAVRVMVSSAKSSMERAGVTVDDHAHVVPHQANQRNIDSACRKLRIGPEKVASVLEHTGNTSSASIPLALVDAVEAGRLSPGDLVLLVGFGAGMTWASAVVEWNP